MATLLLVLIINGQLIQQQISYHSDEACQNGREELTAAYSTYEMSKEHATVFSAVCTNHATGVVF